MPPGGPGVFLDTVHTVPMPPGGPGVFLETMHTVPMPPGGPGVLRETVQTVPIPPGGPGVFLGSTVEVMAEGIFEGMCVIVLVGKNEVWERAEASTGGLFYRTLPPPSFELATKGQPQERKRQDTKDRFWHERHTKESLHS